MHSKFLTGILLIAVSSSLTAQKSKNSGTEIDILKAQKQEWSGGAAGRMGCYYFIEFSTPAGSKGAVPDTLWIGKRCFALTIYEAGAQIQGNCKLTREKSRWFYSLSVNADRSQIVGNGQPQTRLAPESKDAPPYQGEAAIRYTWRGKKKLCPISSFQSLPFAAYP